MNKIEKTTEIGGKKLTLSTGDIAFQATGAVMATYGETVVLATVVAAPMKENLGYFPLFVEYRERLSAGGRIKGSRWVKREGRPTDEEILTARLIDRSIRPLFAKNYNKEVQVIVTALSIDGENNPDMVGGVAVSAAIEASIIPWEGPVAMAKVGLKDGKYLLNPSASEIKSSEIELIVSNTDKAIVMIEAGANEVPEKEIFGGIEFAQKESKEILSFIKDFAKEVGKEKEKLEKEKINPSLVKKVKELSNDTIKDLVKKMSDKEAGYADYDEAKAAVKKSFDDEEANIAGQAFDNLFTEKVKQMILSGKRPDGRKSDEIRDLSAKVDILPRTHGSAIFKRGQTQALTVTTLGSPSLEQLIETAEGQETKRYMHYYSMPPYSVGETGRIGYPSRREIGHGALAERALLPVLPSEEKFPYAIHVITEILSSNGSTSMAATCGSTLSLMDAGVPIKNPVAGIAMGLVIENEKKFAILTDIVGLEDGSGDMDFKVAGTKDGITALQLDVKTLNLTSSILETALKQAKEAREKILEAMIKAIDEPRGKVSEYAPKIKMVKIPQEKIGEIIGPGGKMIRKIMADTNTQLDVNDEGTVSITGISDEEVKKATETVENLVKEVEAGEIYEGEVKRIQPFGAFVEVLPGKDGLVHISDMSNDYVKDPNDVVSIGDKVQVRVKEIDNLGRINLSMILDPSKEKEKGQRNGGGGGDRDKRDSGGRRFEGRRDSRRSRGGSQNQRGKSSGPHFPTSRLLDQEK
jgi:polyribonucleotide nucleotidyltransferase